MQTVGANKKAPVRSFFVLVESKAPKSNPPSCDEETILSELPRCLAARPSGLVESMIHLRFSRKRKNELTWHHVCDGRNVKEIHRGILIEIDAVLCDFSTSQYFACIETGRDTLRTALLFQCGGGKMCSISVLYYRLIKMTKCGIITKKVIC